MPGPTLPSAGVHYYHHHPQPHPRWCREPCACASPPSLFSHLTMGRHPMILRAVCEGADPAKYPGRGRERGQRGAVAAHPRQSLESLQQMLSRATCQTQSDRRLWTLLSLILCFYVLIHPVPNPSLVSFQNLLLFGILLSQPQPCITLLLFFYLSKVSDFFLSQFVTVTSVDT